MFFEVLVGGRHLAPVPCRQTPEFQTLKLLHDEFVRGVKILGAASSWALHGFELEDTVLTVEIRTVSISTFHRVENDSRANGAFELAREFWELGLRNKEIWVQKFKSLLRFLSTYHLFINKNAIIILRIYI